MGVEEQGWCGKEEGKKGQRHEFVQNIPTCMKLLKNVKKSMYSNHSRLGIELLVIEGNISVPVDLSES